MGQAVIEVQEGQQMELDLGAEHGENPFSLALSKGLRTRVKRTSTGVTPKSVVDMSTGVVEGAAEVMKIEEVDPEQFAKVFTAQLGAFYALKERGIRLLLAMWQVYAAEAKKRKENSPLDHLTISPSIYNEIVSRHGGTPASKATYHRALNELIEAGFIVRSKLEHRYWINPAIFFIGSRVKLVTEIREGPQVLLPGEGEK